MSKLSIRLIILISLVSLYSCVQTESSKSVSTTQSFILESSNHIICILDKDETPNNLAQQYLGDKKKAWMIEDINPGANYNTDDAIIIPLTNDNKAGLFKDGYQTVPILTYHRFAKDCSSPLCVPLDLFYEQLQYLKDNNYRVITLEILSQYLNYKKAIPKKSVIITIDDGYKSVYEVAFPVLKQFGFTATLFIYTDFVSGGSAMSWKQIKEMKDAGFEVGSHTLSHTDLVVKKDNETTKEYIDRIKRELVRSKTIIDKKLNQNTLFLAYPFGSSNHEVINLSKAAGYTAGLTVNRGGNPFFRNQFLLYRDQVLSREQSTFISRLKIFKKMALEDKENE